MKKQLALFLLSSSSLLALDCTVLEERISNQNEIVSFIQEDIDSFKYYQRVGFNRAMSSAYVAGSFHRKCQQFGQIGAEGFKRMLSIYLDKQYKDLDEAKNELLLKKEQFYKVCK